MCDWMHACFNLFITFLYTTPIGAPFPVVCSSVQLYSTVGVATYASYESTSRRRIITHRDTLFLHDDPQPTSPRQHPGNAVPHLSLPVGHDVDATPVHCLLDHHDHLHRGDSLSFNFLLMF